MFQNAITVFYNNNTHTHALTHTYSKDETFSFYLDFKVQFDNGSSPLHSCCGYLFLHFTFAQSAERCNFERRLELGFEFERCSYQRCTEQHDLKQFTTYLPWIHFLDAHTLILLIDFSRMAIYISISSRKPSQ